MYKYHHKQQISMSTHNHIFTKYHQVYNSPSTHNHIFTKYHQVYNSPITFIHQVHIYHQAHKHIMSSYQLYAMHPDMTPICMWYQITSEVVTPDANWTSLSTAIISMAIWIQVSGQRQYGCKHPTQHMMHEHMTQSNMHIFITIQ